MMRAFLLATTCLLAACTTPQLQSSIAALEVSLATAETAAISYKGLPACGSAGATAACSDAAIVQKIKDADNVAYKALKDAEAQAAAGKPVDLTVAAAAVTALQSAIPVLAK